MKKRLYAVLLCGLLWSVGAHAFGSPGHMAVGALADSLIEDTPAQAHVRAILGTHETLREAAIWPDCARGVAAAGDGFAYRPDPKYHDHHCAIFETAAGKNEMIDYVSRNWDNCEYSGHNRECHKAFHFADVPLQLGHYPKANDKQIGVGNADVVHAINAAMLFLRDGTQTDPFRFGAGVQGQREALRLLAHLVGDIHQPLHVGAVYLTPSGRATNPIKTKTFNIETETRGGNLMRIGSSGNLHSQWDGITDGLTKEDLSGEAATVAATEGGIESWAAQWATESVHAAKTAYKGLKYGKRGSDGWPVTFRDRPTYLKIERDLQREQITKAGARLAETLQSIWAD